MKYLCIGLGAVLLIYSPATASESIVHAPFSADSAWEFRGTGPYEGWADRRELFTIHHPWAASKTDQYGAVGLTLEAPADWSGRIRLHFYMSDDYDGQHPPLAKEAWVGQIKLVGHRFKQVLVDDEVLWEADVADAEGAAVPMRFNVLLPERIKPGQPFRVTFRLIDKVGSDQRLPDDFRHIGATDSNETDEWKFMTHVYVGDVALTPEATESIPPGESPVMRKVREMHAKNWPIKSLTPKVDFPVSLNWEGADEIAGLECAIHCGIPLPEGRVKDARQVIIKDGSGKMLPLQASAMNHWPDGSVRWVEIDTIASANPANKQLRLDLREEVNDKVKISSGMPEIGLGVRGPELIRLLKHGKNALENLIGQMETGGQLYQCAIEDRKILAEGPIRSEFELSGHIQREGEPAIGRFTFRLAAFAGQPYVRIDWRVFNDRPERLKITRLELVGKYAAGQDNPVDEGEAARGFLGLSDANGSLLVQVRHFREQGPKAIEFKDGQLRIALFEATKDEPAYEPFEGEAKRHEIWLGVWDRPLSDEDMDKWSRYFARPARLFNAEYFCESGGLGHAAPMDEQHFPELLAYFREQYGEIKAQQFYMTGIRNWGDMPYNLEKKQWCNGYYDRQQGMASAYLLTGDPRWFDHLEATVRHIIDVDICHASKEHPDWLGMIHSLFSTDHASDGPWYPQQRIKGTLAYWQLTGDGDAREAALGLADWAVRYDAGIGLASVREQAGTFYSLMAAYDETHDTKYLEAAKKLAHDAMGRIDRRRGCYPESHGNIGYRGNVPWMDAQLSEPMYDYYCVSGDIDAALATVGLAESMIAENCTRGVAGDIFGYSHNPHFKKGSDYHIAIGPAILYAYELSGDAEFLAHGRAMLPQTLREKTLNLVQNCFWNAPAYLYYLRAYEKN